jgi:hypothetical protein
MIVPLARKSVIAGIIHNQPPAVEASTPGGFSFALELVRSTPVSPFRAEPRHEGRICLSSGPEFWTLIEERRRQKTINQVELKPGLSQAP